MINSGNKLKYDKFYDYLHLCKSFMIEKDSVNKTCNNNNGKVEMLIDEVMDILSTKCPNCNTVFCDFDGCSCVTCKNCKHQFCAFCFEYSNKDGYTSHKHVRNCKKNPSASEYAKPKVFDCSAFNYRVEQIYKFFNNRRYFNYYNDVMEKCKKNLADVGITINNIGQLHCINERFPTTNITQVKKIPKKQKIEESLIPLPIYLDVKEVHTHNDEYVQMTLNSNNKRKRGIEIIDLVDDIELEQQLLMHLGLASDDDYDYNDDERDENYIPPNYIARIINNNNNM
jgi:hypothetical protein